MKVLVIADRITCMAFALGGIANVPVSDPNDARTALDAAIKRQEIGLVLITERIADSIRDLVDKVVFQLSKPLLVEIPDVQGPLPKGPSVSAQMISLLSR